MDDDHDAVMGCPAAAIFPDNSSRCCCWMDHSNKSSWSGKTPRRFQFDRTAAAAAKL